MSERKEISSDISAGTVRRRPERSLPSNKGAQRKEIKDKIKPASESESSSESEWEDWSHVITLDDDDEDVNEEDREKASSLRACLRCPTSKQGTFKDRKKYLFHVKRHSHGEVFKCPTCRQLFVSINECVSHEITAHGTVIDSNYFNTKDLVTKKRTQQERSCINDARANTSNLQTLGDDNGITPPLAGNNKTEDKNADTNIGRIRCSTTFLPYSGPTVNHLLETYEIHLNHSIRKGFLANFVSTEAVETHNENVAEGRTEFRLGRFLKRKQSKKSVKKSESRPAIKRSRNRNESEGESVSSNETRRKRARILGDDTLSSGSQLRSLDSVPSCSKSLKTIAVEDNQTSQYNKKGHRVKNGESSNVLSALLRQVCQQCSYLWETESDLRNHRDSAHPDTKLIDLMAIPGQAVPKKRSKPLSGSGLKNKGDEPSLSTATKSAPKKCSINKKAQTIKGRNKSKSTTTTQPRKSHLQLVPDSSFSKKEIFFHALGLSNKVRLHLHLKKPIKDLRLPTCTVNLERMGKLEYDYYSLKNTEASQADILSFHFLLGYEF